MEFSHDDKYLLAVSRDRQLSLFSIDRTDGSDQINYQLLIRQEAHKRIVWACSWNPLGHQFATGSRDKTVKIWEMSRGATAIQEDLKKYYPLNDAAETINEIGSSIRRVMGGTSGILYYTFPF